MRLALPICEHVILDIEIALQSLTLTCLSGCTGARIELIVSNVVALSDYSKTLRQAQAIDTHQLREEVRELRQQEGSFGVPQSHFRRPNVLPLLSGDSKNGADVLLDGRRGLEVQVVWRPRWACDKSCCCLCHDTAHG